MAVPEKGANNLTDNGWRTVLIESKSELSVSDECLVIKSEGQTKKIAINQIGSVVLCNPGTVLTTASLTALASKNVSVIICDNKHNPFCEISCYNSNCFSSKKLSEQIKWSEESKALIWQKIVTRKIGAQAELVKSVSNTAYKKIKEFENSVLPGDITNREAQASRVYFNALFGADFRRRTESSINSALNYGYAILLSSFNRFVTVYGYNTSLGIKHSNGQNPYNLSCDLMEPFRPVIDRFVYQNRERELDIFYKREIVALMYKKIELDGKFMTVNSAVEQFSKETLNSLSAKFETAEDIGIGA